ncbi:MAG TPA: tubulin-like doman-containing protein [Ktedonobacteraceae bacterium]
MNNRGAPYARKASDIGRTSSSYVHATEADTPLTVSQERITTPALVILLGSTASITALELMRHMLTLQQTDQRKVALVYIDTDEPNSSVVEFRQYHNGIFQEFPLRIAVPVGIERVDRINQEYGIGAEDPSEPHTFVRGKLPQYFSNGAGGIRNNGHVAVCFHQKTIYDTLQRALASIMRISTNEGTQRRNEVQVYIVTFMGGGTGSGILADITVMVRDLLALQQYEQRINLFCMLPETVRGANLADLTWRKSNTLACLLELLAFSLAANATAPYAYHKHVREKVYNLTQDAIANEVFLLGRTVMDDPSNTARLVGLDLFQRIANASGVGYLEHSKQVDRRTLGETDDRSLPTMFGTSCPLEVRFPAEETALAFAQLATANILPHLADYRPQPVTLDDRSKREWLREWHEVAPVSANTSNPTTVQPGQISFDEFVEAEQGRLNALWGKVQILEADAEARLRYLINQKYVAEEQLIKETPTAAQAGESGVINRRMHHLQTLQKKYLFILEDLKEQRLPPIFPRPVELEAELTQPGRSWFTPWKSSATEHAREVFLKYNDHMALHARVTRLGLLRQVLQGLLQYVNEALETAQVWFKDTSVDENIHELEVKGLNSSAWLGHLDYPHPHQRHIFDLRSLRASDGHSLAAERLYIWATGGERVLTENVPLQSCYVEYVDECIKYLSNKANDPSKDSQLRLENQNAGRLADSVVAFFREKYMRKFQDMNLFELLEKAAPPNAKGQARTKQISSYLFEHLQHMRGLMSSLIAFEAELWSHGQGNLDTSIYLGIHWRSGGGQQDEILRLALDALVSLTKQGQQPVTQLSFDPHRLQVSYGQHAISIATIRDFYLEQNSSMEAYEYHQQRWADVGNSLQGYMPTHSSEEAQRLVRERNALGKNSNMPLYQRLIRRPGVF